MPKSKRLTTSDKRQQNPIRILFIGDIISQVGRAAVEKVLPGLREKLDIDFIIANGEHLSDRVGIDLDILFEVKKFGIDFFTTGNHVWRKEEFLEEIKKKGVPVIRPANFLAKFPGHGFRVVKTPIGRILIINLLGKEGIPQKVVNPFKKIEQILETAEPHDIAIVDFHAEMSSEKVAMGHFLDGKVTAVLGTHTHVPTADARILPGGTAFVSDVGMTGPLNSVLGVKSDIIIDRFKTGAGQRFEVADEGEGVFNSILLTVNDKFQAIKIKRLDKRVK